MNRALVLTTIYPPGKVVRALEAAAVAKGVPLVVVCDTKTPLPYQCGSAVALTIAEQARLFPQFAAAVPTRHYARKNLGYLYAMSQGATAIVETDDDNSPYPTFLDDDWGERGFDQVKCESKWFNAYRPFTANPIWPRGFPLEFLSAQGDYQLVPATGRPLIVQGLADENPDVDAVYRLTRQLPVRFKQRGPVCLPPGLWCPFNSQNTMFRREAFPLLYLPSFCSFRMTDIWRSLVAQRCLWEMGSGVLFTAATVFQERNEHNFLKDFEDEIPGYLRNEKIRQILEATPLTSGDPGRNICACYESLVRGGIFVAEELPLLRSWLAECENWR